MPNSVSWPAKSLTVPVVAATSQTVLTRRRSRGLRTHTLPDALATSMAATRSMTSSCSASGISCGTGVRFGFDLNLPFLQPHPHSNRRVARGPRSKGTEILTGVLEATVRDPPGRAPAPRLKCGFTGPKIDIDVDRRPEPIFTPARRPGNGTGGSNEMSNACPIGHFLETA